MDRTTYFKACLLNNYVNKIHNSYNNNLQSTKTSLSSSSSSTTTTTTTKKNDIIQQQLTTATWLIDKLSFHIGDDDDDHGNGNNNDNDNIDNNKDIETVCCCTMTVESISFDVNNHNDNDNNNEGNDVNGNKIIEFTFLGKDSMIFKQTIDLGMKLYNETPERCWGNQVYENLKFFCQNKNKKDKVFDSINSILLKNHLQQQFMDGLNDIVFCIYNASKILQNELHVREGSSSSFTTTTTTKITNWKNLSITDKINEYNIAHQEVARICNHQRFVSKAYEVQLETMRNKLELLKNQREELQTIERQLLAGSETNNIQLRMISSLKEMEDDIKISINKAKELKNNAKNDNQEREAVEAMEIAKQKKIQFVQKKMETSHLFEKIPTLPQVQKRITIWTSKINHIDTDMNNRNLVTKQKEKKEIFLPTCKINYTDPRITIAFCKRNDIPIAMIYTKNLQENFHWAMEVPSTWEFQ